MPDTDRVAASRAAVEARQARARIKDDLKRGNLSHLTVLKNALVGQSAAASLRVSEFLGTLQGVGRVKLPQIMSQLRISESKRLGGLGRIQAMKLEEYLREKLKVADSGLLHPLTVLAGPTAVGKGTVAAYIRENYPAIKLSVSVTTRPPRPGEIDGVHYIFISDEEFDRLLVEDGFLEWAVVHNAYRYGTPRSSVLEASARGEAMLLEIDLQGARQIKVAMPEAKMVFLAPPSWDELVNRLVGRGTEDESEQKRRLETAKEELAAAEEFDEIIINDSVAEAAEKLVEILLGQRG